MKEEKDADHRKKITNRLNLVIKNLKTTAFKTSVMKEEEKLFYVKNKKFEEKLDNDRHLVGFDDKILDLETMEARQGKPSDNVSFSVGYNFPKKYSSKKQELLKFLTDIQPKKAEREYLLTFLASLLYGSNDEEQFYIFSGQTRNGKSKLAELIKATLCSYYATVSSNLLTKERPSSDKPQPEIIALKGKRVIVSSEPENNQRINNETIKLYSGNDEICARKLFENKIITFIPQFRIIILCNDIPALDKNEEAIWERCRCIEFPIKFVENPTNDNEKKIDKNIKHKILSWRADFMLLLLEYYAKYKEIGLVPTNNIMKFTKTFH